MLIYYDTDVHCSTCGKIYRPSKDAEIKEKLNSRQMKPDETFPPDEYRTEDGLGCIVPGVFIVLGVVLLTVILIA